MTDSLSANLSGQYILSVTGLQKTVPIADSDLTILSGISFSIKPSESVAIVGVSGSGKSTLLGILAGLDSPTSGTVTLCGQTLDKLDEDGRAAVRGEQVGFVFQSFQLLPNLTALENTLLPLEVLGRDNEQNQAEKQAIKLLNRVGLGDRLNHYPRQLSGGEQQRVAIARAFVVEPQILFADEPTGNLDTTTGKTVIDLLFDMNREKNTTLVLVTHDTNLAERCQRRLELSAGQLLETSQNEASVIN